MAGFQTQREIQALLAAAGLRPQRRHGQHFLIDRNLMTRLADSAVLDRSTTVIEIGAGTGSLTSLLAARAGHVHTFEVDRRLAAVARGQLAGFSHVTLHEGDALRTKNALCDALAGLVRSRPPADRRIVLVANLPYDAATPLVTELLLAPHPPSRMCFTIQREVADRLTASAGSRDYGPVAILCALHARVERLANVPAAAFWPRPKVDSMMLRLVPHDPPADAEQRKALAIVTRKIFQHRRKRMEHILREWLGPQQARAALAAAGIDGDARPEAVLPDAWDALASCLD